METGTVSTFDLERTINTMRPEQWIQWKELLPKQYYHGVNKIQFQKLRWLDVFPATHVTVPLYARVVDLLF